ncbi:PAS domain S-box protein, partial [Muricoccus aerilatus]|uniref:PAS domain S-box protein n=1 Tax=Muricoccus aerilatus TaxID=452982 RepID=UPI0005C1B7B6
MADLPSHDNADQQQLRLILAALQDGVILIGPDQAITWANNAALRMHGVHEVAELGATVSEYRRRFELRYRNRHRLPEGAYPMERVMAGEAFDEVVVEVAPAGENEALWTHRIRSLVLNDAAGVPNCLVLILNDETERFDAEERFEAAFSANPAPAVILRLSDHRHIKVNRGFLEMTGYVEEQVVGRSAYEIDVLEGAARREFAVERLQQGRTIPQMEAVLQLPGGGEKRVVVAGQPIEVGNADCMLFTFVDIEPHKRTEEALRRSEEGFGVAFRLAPVPTILVLRSGCRLLRANDAFVRESGYAEAELIGKEAGEIG